MAKVRRVRRPAAKRTSKAKATKKVKLPKDFQLPSGGRPEILKGRKPVAMLLDGDICMFHVVTNAIKEHRHKHREYSYTLDMGEVEMQFTDRVLGLAGWLRAKKIVVAFSGDQYFRKTILPTYKFNRTGKKPLGYRDAVEWAMQNDDWKSMRIATLEADDILGLLATMPSVLRQFQPVIVSDDKDMYTIPSLHLRFKKSRDEDKNGVFEIDKARADYNHLVQALTGDSGDGYYGIKGVGPGAADKILCGQVGAEGWRRVVAAYKEAGFTAKDALQQARCARILRHPEFNMKTGVFKLWTPPKKKSRR